MTPHPKDLAEQKGPDLLKLLAVFCEDKDKLLIGSRQVREKHFLKRECPDLFNQADIYFATRRLFERMLEIGGRDATIRDLTSTVRNALEEAANMRGQHGKPANTTADPPGASDEDSGSG